MTDSTPVLQYARQYISCDAVSKSLNALCHCRTVAKSTWSDCWFTFLCSSGYIYTVGYIVLSQGCDLMLPTLSVPREMESTLLIRLTVDYTLLLHPRCEFSSKLSWEASDAVGLHRVQIVDAATGSNTISLPLTTAIEIAFSPKGTFLSTWERPSEIYCVSNSQSVS